jgi:GTP-binding protein Era
MNHKAGFVNIIGNPNVGKSTLMNQMVGEKISIITSKSQTTRHRIMGIVNGDDFQIVYSDTPGIINPAYRMQESMMNFVSSAFEDADVILYMTDTVETRDKYPEYLERIKKTDTPVLILINKMDLTPAEKVLELQKAWREEVPNATVYFISALKNYNVDLVFEHLLKLLPENPPYFPKDQLTDKTERFIVSEIIREKILMNYKQEIPYSTEVVVESFKEEEKIIRIEATIYVARESQKGILIGKKGLALKRVGQHARQDAETFFGKQIYLGLYVRVKKDWRDDKNLLRQFGY